MLPVILGIAVIVVIAVVLYLRSQKQASLESGSEPEALPPPKAESIEPKSSAKQAEPATKAPAVSSTEVKVAKPAAIASSPAPSPVAETATTAGSDVKAADAEKASTAENVEAAADVDTTASPRAPVESPSAPKEPLASAVATAEKATPAQADKPASREQSRKPKASDEDVAALKRGLKSARGSWVQRLIGIFAGKKTVSPELITDMEEVLLTGDVGVRTTERVIEQLKAQLDNADVSDEQLVWSTLRSVSRRIIDVEAPPFGHKAQPGQPLVILVVGVNGVGKTTTIGKLASRYKEQGKKVYLAAGDTFRAAAVKQLELWGARVGVEVVKGKDLTKPSAVVFDAVQTGVKDGADVVIADTAGRLHTKTPLMDELRKLGEAANKALPGAPHEILLVLDATTGQNAVVQVTEFKNALAVTGIVLTKLDGTAKGGVMMAVCDEHKIPVRFVGVGENVDDLRVFDAEAFTDALFSSEGMTDEEQSA